MCQDVVSSGLSAGAVKLDDITLGPSCWYKWLTRLLPDCGSSGGDATTAPCRCCGRTVGTSVRMPRALRQRSHSAIFSTFLKTSFLSCERRALTFSFVLCVLLSFVCAYWVNNNNESDIRLRQKQNMGSSKGEKVSCIPIFAVTKEKHVVSHFEARAFRRLFFFNF